MVFRDDEDALLARADALQRDLDRTKEELAAKEASAAATERKLEETEHKLADAEEKLARAGVVPRPPPASGELHNRRVLIAISIVLSVLVGLGVIGRCSSAGDAPPNPECTLATDPPGAEIVAVCSAQVDRPEPITFEMKRGRTPLTQSRQDWIMQSVICHGRLVARLDGYADTPVSDPLEGRGCSKGVTPLRKLD